MDSEKKSDLIPQFNQSLLGKLGLSPHDDEAAQQWPLLIEMLLPKYDDKGRLTREAGILSIKVDGPVFRVSMICPSEEGQTVMTLSSIVGLLDQLEVILNDPRTVWTKTFDSKKRTGQALRNVLGY